jgi:photosystem II stability/assembly factor-like uncharacterized protein
MRRSLKYLVPLASLCLCLAATSILHFGYTKGGQPISRKTPDQKNDQLILNSISLPRGVRDIALMSKDEVWAVGVDWHDARLAWHSKDGGVSWETLTLPTRGWAMSEIGFWDHEHGWASGDHRLIMRTSDAGKSWRSFTLPIDERIQSIYFLNHLVGYASVTTSYYDREKETTHPGINKILRTEDTGHTWQVCYQDAGVTDFFDIAALSDQIVIVALGGDKLLRTSDGGRSWQTVAQQERAFLSVAFSPDGVGWAVGVDGVFHKSTDQGKSWRAADSVPKDFFKRQWNNIRFDSAGTSRGIAIAEDGTIAVTQNSGVTWTEWINRAEGRPYKIRLLGTSGVIMGVDKSYQIHFGPASPSN